MALRSKMVGPILPRAARPGRLQTSHVKWRYRPGAMKTVLPVGLAGTNRRQLSNSVSNSPVVLGRKGPFGNLDRPEPRGHEDEPASMLRYAELRAVEGPIRDVVLEPLQIGYELFEDRFGSQRRD